MNLTKNVKQYCAYLFGSFVAHRSRIKQIVDAKDYASRMRQFLHYAKAEENVPNDEPVFIFSAGWRSGSTLLQRLLSSSESLLLWGEPHDRSNIIQSLASTIEPFNDNWPPRKYIADNDEFKQNTDKWIANFYPSESRILAAHRIFVRTLFSANVENEVNKRWGIKEVRYGLKEAVFLKALFPNAKFLYLKRDLKDAYFSYKNFSQHMNWYAKWPHSTVFTPFAFAKHRARLVKEFSQAQKLTGGLIVDYDDIVSNKETLTNIENYCNIKIERAVLEKNVGSALNQEKAAKRKASIGWFESCLLRLGDVRGSKPSLRFSLIKRILKFIEQRAYTPSTAQKIRVNFDKNGDKLETLNTQYLSKTYLSMFTTDDRPDFTNINDLFIDCGQPDKQSQDDCLGVILETRCHPLLEKVVVDFVKRTGYRVQLFHGNLNLNFILSGEIRQLVENKKVILTPLNTDEVNGKTYNAIFLSHTFWTLMHARQKIFVFQTDSLLCPSSNVPLSEFVQYDYIGSWWPRLRPIGITVDGGNGGLSIRDWQQSVNCLERFDPIFWPGGEDGYFAFHIDLMGGKIARGQTCARFSTQYRYLFNSYGCHKISCLNKADKNKFLRYFNEASVLIDDDSTT
ncbi:DUF5672 family protein [Paraglaciecola sp. L1A13]|uniref:DUF5672 family protein n=1 Tax=Paraglaciecola sp. L1A13 TaxID=2686359 RepID=UPI00131DEA67|nr:DUF5672 family protein [Paraglaciecola sp. L1A13]